MSLTFRSFCENGGGKIAYLWHVGGFPWAVTNNAKLITALSNTGNSTVQAARKRLFGSNEWTASGTVTPAYTVPIFEGLHADFGKLKYSVDESKGMLKGGDWSVKVDDILHGHTWQHAATGDEIWGLEGLHRVANVKSSSVHGWGYLDRNLLRIEDGFNPSSVHIYEQSGNLLRARVDACTGDDYVVIWMNNEAMAVSAVDGTFPQYELDFTDPGSDDHRGLYRSKPQDHFVDVLTDMNPIIADVPGSIRGRYCWLYGIPLVNDELVLNESSEPLIAELEGGVITPNISTKNSVTTVRIRNKLSALERTVSVTTAKAQETSMAGFLFSRGESGCTLGGANDDIRQYVQMPHFVIREYRGGWSNLYDALEGGESKTELVSSYWFTEKYIWICGKNSTRLFDTPFQVMEALNDELQACFEQSSERFSEDTTLKRPYKVQFEGNQFAFRYSGTGGDIRNDLRSDYLTNDNEVAVIYPYITGPLAWVFALGTSLQYDCAYNRIISDHLRIQYMETVVGAQGIGSSDASVPYDSDQWRNGWWLQEIEGTRQWTNVDIQNAAIPKYYIQHDWHEIPIDLGITPTGVLPQTPTWEGHGVLYLPAGTPEEGYTGGEYLTLGDGRWFPRLNTSVDSVDDDLTTTTLTALYPAGINTSAGEMICRGASLFFLPLMEIWTEEDPSSIEQLDPHYVYKSTDASSTSLSGIMRSMLGEYVAGISIAKEIQISDVPFFNTTGDFVSTIDWDSLDALPKINGQTYWLDMAEEESVYAILKHEVLLHCAHMTREWDEADMMFKYRFRNLGPPSSSEAQLLGYILDADKALGGAPGENNGTNIPYNAVRITIKGGTQTANFLVKTRNASIVGTDERRTLGLTPKISEFNMPEMPGIDFGGGSNISPTAVQDVSRALTRLVIAMSEPRVEQQKGITTMQWLYPVGREILVTDPTAREPETHRLGLDDEPAVVTEISFEIGKQKGTLTYRIGSASEARSYGYAPTCMLTAGNFTKEVGEWGGTPEDHQYTYSTQPKDVYFFDCWNFPSGPGTPVARNCSCGNYKVWAYEVGTYNWTPLEFTCSVSSAGVITLYGTTTNIDLAKDYKIKFREWADLEDCQKIWCTRADDNNTIGSTSEIAHRWV